MSKKYTEMTKDELLSLKDKLSAEYEEIRAKGLNLNMSRGKPSSEQLDLSMGMMDILSSNSNLVTADGTDCRNYGGLDGIPEAKELMASIMEVSPSNIMVLGNSSLNLMYDSISRSFSHGVMGNTPWCKFSNLKWLCIVPGYDRHFAITDFFGFESINIPMYEDGPDMDLIETLVSTDESIKGIWCVPKYSNPTGNSYSDEVVRRFAALKPLAKDFRIYWDDAYTIHHLYENDKDNVLEILKECEKADNKDLVYKFASTSKISFAGSGIAAIASSIDNLKDIKKSLFFQTIGPDKINQLRHLNFFKDIDGINSHMKKHADILRPKFEMVEDILESELGSLGIASWTKPKGGYFISFDTLPNCAKKVVSYCAEAGVVMTPAGATFPRGIDIKDSNIRIAPSFPTVKELRTATYLLALAVKLVSIDYLLTR